MVNSEVKPAPGGPPKKGLWGFLAGLFPKRPEILEPPTPTANVQLESKASELNPSDTNGEFQSQERPMSPEEAPQTEEEAAPNSQGETAPPTVAAPQNVKAPTLSENEDNPPTLATTEPASGGSEEDSSTPDPGESYDPKSNK